MFGIILTQIRVGRMTFDFIFDPLKFKGSTFELQMKNKDKTIAHSFGSSSKMTDDGNL